MTWFKVDDGLHAHPKWLALSPAARGLWISAGSWCASQLTDGFVPKHVLPVLGGRPRDAAELVSVGLWLTEPDGWRFHDWLDFQPSKTEVDAERAAARERMKKLRQGRKGSADVRANIERTSEEVLDPRPVPTRPDPETPSSSSHNFQQVTPPSFVDDDDLVEANLRMDELEMAGVVIDSRPAYLAAVLRDIRSERAEAEAVTVRMTQGCTYRCEAGWLQVEGGFDPCPDCLPGMARRKD